MKMELCASRLHVGRHEWTLIRVLHLHCCCLVDDPLLELTHLQTAATHCRSGRFTKTEGDFMFFFPVNPVIDCVPLLSMYLLSIYDRWDRFQPSCNPEWGTHEWMDGFSICNKGVFVPYFMSWFHQSKKKDCNILETRKNCWLLGDYITNCCGEHLVAQRLQHRPTSAFSLIENDHTLKVECTACLMGGNLSQKITV